MGTTSRRMVRRGERTCGVGPARPAAGRATRRAAGRAAAWLLAGGAALLVLLAAAAGVRLSGDPSRRVWIFLPARPFDQAEIVGVDSPPWGVLAADERAALVLRPEQTLSTRIRRGLGLAPSGPDEIANEATTYEATGETRTEDGRLLREYVFTGTPNGAPVVAAIQAARRRPVEVRLAEVEAAPTPVTVPADGRPRVVAKDDALGVLFVRAADPMPALRQDVSFRRPGGGWVMGWVAVAGTTAYAVAAFPGQRWDDVTVGDEAVFRD